MRKTVVVAEDDSLIRMDLVEMLRENEYDVLGEAKDGLEAVELALRHTPDILLLDLKMPFLLGTNVAKILKEKEYKNCIIMLTAYSMENYIKEATEYDVSGYLIKPLDEKILLSQMDLLYKNYSEKIKLKNALELSERKLKERKMLEKAKGILMCKYSLTEDEAYTKIRRISMEKRISICQLSEIINTTGELL
ncbi:MAG: ANTAR domain-containing response regulator [Cetobacterium sp.]|uniref:ANTAR domain-containing response regulator n=4 Tax=Fusobacteriaceae TaxID=203492 RepID=UPI001F06FF05|nr:MULTISPECIES: response regulator [Cetobacterium]MCX3066761.1 response regulator [Cetobacterium somerae]UPO98603.1 response regulator [Cetobacterium somerae]